ncbi:GIN domain-containing protein [Spirosoma validum]|uniref:DUF2807 domain-containing protein n=1 Tax=Spirosoma validum TaxID=2771355 RepID=A0A927GH15_9BACT|nr:DUF2807 domain-containing protein [Spirosoma validum]MBD2757464.1 DUF2807 domain-containing protein [Spirosoma validum]
MDALSFPRSYAQGNQYDPQNELRGNGKPVQFTKPTKPFTAVEIRPFPADIMIDAGADESVIAVAVDENLRPFLRIDEQAGKLMVSFEHPQGKPFWVSSKLIKMTIKTPELTGLLYQSNSKLVVNNLHGDSLEVANQGNATITLQGSVKTMKLTNSANGTVHAEKLITQKADVVSHVNGNVRVNAKEVSSVNTGLGSIVNVADSAQKPKQ